VALPSARSVLDYGWKACKRRRNADLTWDAFRHLPGLTEQYHARLNTRAGHWTKIRTWDFPNKKQECDIHSRVLNITWNTDSSLLHLINLHGLPMSGTDCKDKWCVSLEWVPLSDVSTFCCRMRAFVMWILNRFACLSHCDLSSAVKLCTGNSFWYFCTVLRAL
jgi:hypothetical protein